MILPQRLSSRLPISSVPSYAGSLWDKTYQGPDTPTLCQFHNNPNPRTLHQTPIVLDHIHVLSPSRVHKLLEQGDLLLDIPNIIVFCIEIYDFESYDMA